MDKNKKRNKPATPGNDMMKAVISEILDTLGAPVVVKTNHQGEPALYFVFGMPEDEIRECKDACADSGGDLLDELVGEGALAIRIKETDIMSM